MLCTKPWPAFSQCGEATGGSVFSLLRSVQVGYNSFIIRLRQTGLLFWNKDESHNSDFFLLILNLHAEDNEGERDEKRNRSRKLNEPGWEIFVESTCKSGAANLFIPELNIDTVQSLRRGGSSDYQEGKIGNKLALTCSNLCAAFSSGNLLSTITWSSAAFSCYYSFSAHLTIMLFSPK